MEREVAGLFASRCAAQKACVYTSSISCARGAYAARYHSLYNGVEKGILLPKYVENRVERLLKMLKTLWKVVKTQGNMRGKGCFAVENLVERVYNLAYRGCREAQNAFFTDSGKMMLYKPHWKGV